MTRVMCGLFFAVLLSPLATSGCNREVAGGRADGPVIFDELCARCHGPKGIPEPALAAQLGVQDLTTAELQTRLSDESIRSQIRFGSKNGRMPALGGSLSDAQIDAVVTHVRSLAKAAPR